MDTIQVDFGLMLLLGLVSSLHCGMMCGPMLVIAAAPVSNFNRDIKFCWRPLLTWQASYHLGRAMTYCAIGALLASLQVGIARLIPFQRIGSIFQIVMGASILILAVVFFMSEKTIQPPHPSGRFITLFRRILTIGHPWGMLVLGVLTGFLPCGVLYVAFLRTAAATSAWEGGRLMLAFWIGTTPLLLVIGLISTGAMHWLTRQKAALVLAMVIAIGIWVLYRGTRGVIQQQDHSAVQSMEIHGGSSSDSSDTLPHCPGHL